MACGALVAANQSVRAYATRHADFVGMAATAVVAVVRLGVVAVGYVGDARAYRFRQGRLEAVTVDHTPAGTLAGCGAICRSTALAHPGRGVLLRCIGANPVLRPGLWTGNAQAGDRFLLCTDGLTGSVSLQDMELVLAGNRSPRDAVDALMQAADRECAPDDASAVVFSLGPGRACAPPRRSH